MIEGKYHNLWRENEFTKLQSLVSDLCAHDELEQPIVEQLFKKIFYEDSPDYEINLNKVSLDIYAESDTEDINPQKCDDAFIEENKSSAKIKSPRIARRKTRKITCASLLTPLKKKSGKIQPPKTTSPDMQTQVSQQQMLDLLNSCNKRIDDLEKVTAKLDQSIANSDLELLALNKTVSDSKDDMSKHIESRVKHEVSIIKKDQISLANEVNERISKAESEVKRLQGRVGSLVEEKANLMKRIKTLESDNKKLSEELFVIHCNMIEKNSHNMSEDLEATTVFLNQSSKESSQVKEQQSGTTIRSNQEQQSGTAKISNQGNMIEKNDCSTSEGLNATSVFSNQNSKENSQVKEHQAGKHRTTDTRKQDNSNDQPNKSRTNTTEDVSNKANTGHQHSEQSERSERTKDINTYDFAMLCDSSRRFLDMKKLCPKSSSKMIACGTTKKAIEILNTPRFNVNKGIIINTGVNDIDHMATENLVKDQVLLVNTATRAFPEVKVILSGITPRNDNLDQSVIVANREIHEEIKNLPNVFHVYNGDLRQVRYYHDVKHLNKKVGIPTLAKNIKKELRLAFQPTKHQESKQERIPSRSPIQHQSSDAQRDVKTNTIGTPTFGPQEAIQQQLQNVTNTLNHLVQSIVSQQQHPSQRPVMYRPLPYPIYNF